MKKPSKTYTKKFTQSVVCTCPFFKFGSVKIFVTIFVRILKRQNMRDRNTQVRSPSPIPVKFAPEVGIGPKTHHAKYFWIFIA